MTQPFLHLRDVGSVFERVRCCGCSERVRSEGIDADADRFRVVHHHVPVHRIAGQRLLQLPIRPAHWPEEGTLGIRPMPGGIEVVLDQGEGFRVHRGVAELSTLAVHREGHDPTALHKVFNLQGAQFRPTEAVVEEDSEYRPVSLAFEGRGVRSVEELPSLLVRDGGRFPFIRPFGGPFDTVDRVDNDGVFLAQVVEQVGQSGELPADGCRSHRLVLQRLAPGNDVGSGDDAEVSEVLDANKLHELPNIVPVGPASVGVGDVRKPLRLGRDVGEALKLCLGDETLF